MFELSRARLVNVGPAGARFDDVLLDFRDPSSGLPASTSVIWLPNGGGKSTMMQLIFSVLLPRKDQTIGHGASTKTLSELVLRGDTSHIILEWRRVSGDGPPLLLTAKVLEWQGLRPSSNLGQLREHWWMAFSDQEALTLDNVPVSGQQDNGTDGYRRLTAFLDRLRDLGREDLSLQLSETDKRTRWTERLADAGIDSQLYAYQAIMNRGEGGAAELFQFKNVSAFIDFFLEATVDDQSAESVAANVRAFAEELRQRDITTLEHQFSDGAARLLAPVADAVASHRKAAADVDAAYQQATRAHASLQAGAEKLRSDAEALHAQAGLADERRAQANTAWKGAQDDVVGVRHMKAALELAVAKQRNDQAEEAVAHAKYRQEVREGAGTVAVVNDLRAQKHGVQAAMLAEEQEAAPLLRARNDAAAKLVAGLQLSARTADENAITQAQQAEEAGTASRHAQEAANEAQRKSTEARVLARHHDHSLTQLAEDLETARRRGLLDDAERPEQAITRRSRESAQAQQASQDMAVQQAEIDERSERRVVQRGELEIQANLVSRQAEDTQRRIDELKDALGQLTADPVLCELVSAREIDPWTESDRLKTRLKQRESEITDRVINVRLRGEEDQRTVNAVQNDGLLPLHHEADAFLNELNDAGVAAVTGWDYMEQTVPADQRPRLLDAFPYLPWSIVISHAAHWDKAAAIATARGATARSLIHLAQPSGFDIRLAQDEVSSLAVSGHPGLWDGDAARDEAARASERLTSLAEELQGLQIQLRDVQEAARRLHTFLQRYSADMLGQLTDEHVRLIEQFNAVQAEIEALRDADASDRRRRSDLTDQIAAKSQAISRCALEIAQLTPLRERDEQSARWRAEKLDCDEEAAAQAAAADEHEAQAAKRRRVQQACLVAASQHESRRNALRDEMGAIEGAPEDVEGVLDSTFDLAQLRSSYELSSDLYERKQSTSKLAGRLEEIDRQIASASVLVNAIGAAARQEIDQILATIEGSDPSSRAALLREAEQAVEAALRQRGSAASALVLAQRAREDLPPHRRSSVPQDLQTSDVDAVPGLLRLAERRAEEANRRHEELDAFTGLTRQRAKDSESSAALLSEVANGLRAQIATAQQTFDLQIEISDGAPWQRSVEDAQAHRQEVERALAEATIRLTRVQAARDRAAEAVRDFALDSAYDRLEGRYRLLLRDTNMILARAANLAEDLSTRASNAALRLKEIDEHRAVLQGDLWAICSQALRQLTRAEKASTLPDGLDDWSGAAFLRIRFEQPSEDVALAYMGTVIDEAASATSKQTGTALLLRAVHAAVGPRGFDATVLKPQEVLVTQRVSVDEMHKFSEGQQLTAAIALYLTLATMRANSRGADRSKGTMLFVDNPIGKASAYSLIDIQMKVARQLGIQLLYTTGLNDDGPLSQFKRVVRMRNDHNLRNGLQHVHLDEDYQRALDVVSDSEHAGHVRAVAVSFPAQAA